MGSTSEILGEACKSISVDVRLRHPDVPWSAIVGMRNVLVHDYFGIDLAEVWSTVEWDLAVLRAQLEVALVGVEDTPRM